MPVNQPEHRFQAFVDRLIDRVVLPPAWTTGVDAAGKRSGLARVRMAGRGIKFGCPDLYVCQGDPTISAWIELKVRGNKADERQQAVMAQIRACGISTAVCYDLFAVLEVLAGAGFRLHGNARAIAQERSERWRASEEKAALHPKKTRSSVSKTPRERAGLARIRRANALRGRVMF